MTSNGRGSAKSDVILKRALTKHLNREGIKNHLISYMDSPYVGFPEVCILELLEYPSP